MAINKRRCCAIFVMCMPFFLLFFKRSESRINTLNKSFVVTITPRNSDVEKEVNLSVFKQRRTNDNTNNVMPTIDYVDSWMRQLLNLHQTFKSKTMFSCNNTCVYETEVCTARRIEQWEQLLTSDKLKAVPLFSNEDTIFPWEKDYLSWHPLDDLKHLPNVTLSKVYHLSSKNSSTSKKVACRVNEILIFRVDLKDDYGAQRKYGGDEVRAWITNGSLSMTSSVKDAGNGSYLIKVIPIWEGKFNLNVAVVYPREYLRLALYHMKEGRHRFIFGLFEKGPISEVTICHTTPNIPGRPCVCNYTAWNRASYYCGMPLDNRLSCKDWVYFKPASCPIATDATPAEATMAAKMARVVDDATIKCDILIEATTQTDTPVNQLPYCVQFKNRTMTWNRDSPLGAWHGGKHWQSFLCREPPLTSSWVTSCLQSTSLWMIGDSNLDRLYQSLRTFVSFQYPPSDKTPWPVEKVGVNSEYNITLHFRGHEYPLFYYVLDKWIPVLNQGGIEDYISKIPSTGQHLVIIHYNLHLAVSHLGAIFQRFVSAKEAVRKLFRRNPSVLVAIRGPHVSAVEWEDSHLFGGDVQGRFILRLLNDVFEDMKHRILFLDGWDMTTSFKNEILHPSSVVTHAMLRTLLAFKCS